MDGEWRNQSVEGGLVSGYVSVVLSVFSNFESMAIWRGAEMVKVLIANAGKKKGVSACKTLEYFEVYFPAYSRTYSLF